MKKIAQIFVAFLEKLNFKWENICYPQKIQIHWPEYFLTLELNNITKQYAVKWCNLKKGQNYII